MARAKKKPRVQQYTQREILDATPERLAKGDLYDWVNPAEIDDTEQAIGRNRRFKSTPLDRFYANEKITYRQYEAGDQYRNNYQVAGFATAVISSYGERTSRGEPAYGLARTFRQVSARQFCRSIMSDLTFAENRMMTRFLVQGYYPSYKGSRHRVFMTEVRRCLDLMADYIKLA